MASKIDISAKIPELVSIRPVTGTSIVNHQIRVKLNLSLEEYVIMEYIEKCARDVIGINYPSIYEKTGIEHDDAKELFVTLWTKGFIETTQSVSKFKPTSKWFSALSSIKNEFEEFWMSMHIKTANGKKNISWTGSKQDALNKFTKARKIESFEYLMAQKELYFKMIASSDFRKVMGCSVFLNVDTKRYSEDWGKSINKEIVVEEIVPGLKLTKEMVKDQF